jgi:ornithine--oxo-acid transaminase
MPDPPTFNLAGLGSAAELEDRYCAHNYAPLPVSIVRGHGAWVEDDRGVEYLDLIAAYGALNFGHCHPRLNEVATHQLATLSLTSRAIHHDQLGPYCRELAELCGMEAVIPMNTGADAIETAIKMARRWAYRVKGVPLDQATVVVCDGNFHGRTTTIVGFSSDAIARDGFGPFTPGFVQVPYGDADAVARAFDANTAAVLVEPIQGEAGVIVPPAGYLRALRELCSDAEVLLIADEVQTGLGRTGTTFACDHEDVRPDAFVLGKALGGGIVPASAVVADRFVLDVFTPGSHGSTFAGNPLACAIGRAVIEMLQTGEVQERSKRLGYRLHSELCALVGHGVTEVRGRGLWAGIQLDPSVGTGRAASQALLRRRVLAKETHGQTLRISPPLVITDQDLEWASAQIADTITNLREN